MSKLSRKRCQKSVADYFSPVDNGPSKIQFSSKPKPIAAVQPQTISDSKCADFILLDDDDDFLDIDLEAVIKKAEAPPPLTFKGKTSTVKVKEEEDEEEDLFVCKKINTKRPQCIQSSDEEVFIDEFSPEKDKKNKIKSDAAKGSAPNLSTSSSKVVFPKPDDAPKSSFRSATKEDCDDVFESSNTKVCDWYESLPPSSQVLHDSQSFLDDKTDIFDDPLIKQAGGSSPLRTLTPTTQTPSRFACSGSPILGGSSAPQDTTLVRSSSPRRSGPLSISQKESSLRAPIIPPEFTVDQILKHPVLRSKGERLHEELRFGVSESCESVVSHTESALYSHHATNLNECLPASTLRKQTTSGDGFHSTLTPNHHPVTLHGVAESNHGTRSSDSSAEMDSFSCDSCKFVCSSAEENTQHRKSHFCDLCGAFVSFPKQMKTHLSKVHGYSNPDLKSFKCNICHKTYSSSGSLYTHKKTLHTKAVFPCDTCGKTFKHARLLSIHVVRHKEKTIKCTECDASFFIVSELNKHVNRVHRKIRSYECPVCNRYFSQRSTLTHHMSQHTSTDGIPVDSHKFGTEWDGRTKHRIPWDDEVDKVEICVRNDSASGDAVISYDDAKDIDEHRVEINLEL